VFVAAAYFLYPLVKTTPHATGGKKQGANYRLQKKQNNGLNEYKTKLLQRTPGNIDTVRNKWTTSLVDDIPCEVKEFYGIKKF
jgi:hypothetical protein